MIIDVDSAATYVYTGAQSFKEALPSIVFIHGGGCDHTVWVLQSRYFANHHYNALAVDLPGHGRSEGDLCTSIEGYADWIIKMLNELHISQAVVAGHSMGSLVALECAARHPTRVSHLALIGTSTPMPVTDELLNAAGENAVEAFDMINIWGHTLGHIGGHRAPGMWMMGGTVRLLQRSGPGVLHNDLNACNTYKLGGSAAKVTCPTTLILGELDMMSPPKRAQKLVEDIPNSTVNEVIGSGHMLMAEKPDEVLESLVSLVTSS